MLRACSHQAEGLVTLGDRTSPRLIAVVQHGDEQAELPFLWQLCLTLSQFAYSVTVLDGTSTESTANPGLQQHLNGGANADSPQAAIGAWAVLPAKEGLMHLAVSNGPHQRGWHQLLRAFVGTGVVILYCNAELASQVLKGLETSALIPVSPERSSLLSSYLALKRLLILGGHRPTIIDVQSTDKNANTSGVPAVCTSLVECARNFLSFEVKVISFADIADDEQATADFNRFALSLLESAEYSSILRSEASTDLGRQHTSRDGKVSPFARTVDVHR